MATPSFDGDEIFGAVWEAATIAPNPPDYQWNAFPGVNGRERIFLGSRGYAGDVRFYLIADDEATLASYEAVFNAYLASGYSSVFTDSLGASWPDSTIAGFAPLGKPEPCQGGVGRWYAAHIEVRG